MWRVRINAPSCDGRAIGSFWRLPNSSKPSRKEAKWRPGYPVETAPRAPDVDPQRAKGASSNRQGCLQQGGRTYARHHPRTVDFHRANLLKKLGARNAADLVHKVLGE